MLIRSAKRFMARHLLQSSAAGVENLLARTPAGGQVRVRDVASMRTVASPAGIRGSAASPYPAIGFDVRGRNVQDVVRDVRATARSPSIPLEYHAGVLGEFAAGVELPAAASY